MVGEIVNLHCKNILLTDAETAY